ncbi:MAG: response regulator [Deltaproteobacteria bacterium]|nr:response regulator [Deltaproteobacteria bacterium]MBW2137073.1 response regulator [Deltaproteobacteria bacterium]
MKKGEWKVLLIDDEEGIRKVMSITLEDAGYKVLTAPGGEEGLELCRESRPEIVITDVRMPGIDGIEVLRGVKEEDQDIEVIVVTAFGDMETAVRALQLDASDYVTKPIENEALLVALERAKDRYKRRKELREYTNILENRWMETAEELAKAFDFQNNLIESSIDGIVGCGAEGRIMIFNRSLEEMLGYSKDEVVKRLLFDQLFPVGSAEKIRGELDSEEHGGRNRLYLYETHLLSKAGEKVPVQLSATVFGGGEKQTGMVAFIRDLREIRRLEQQFADQTRIIHQHKMMSLGRLAASVVHEINNPLAGILNYIRLMLKIIERGPLEGQHLEKFRRYLSVIEEETGRCSKIVSNLLAFSRKSKMEFSDVDVNELLEKCILLSQHRLNLQNIAVQSNFERGIPVIWGDQNQLQQCIINLIFNAIDAMPTGGTLTLGSAFHPREKYMEIRVADTGSGISKEDLPHIFDPFYTTKTEGEGLGLGLSTVYGIIDRHKGTISVESRPGKGTAFTIKIPVKEPVG